MSKDYLIANGTKAPEFTLPTPDENPLTLADYVGKWVVLYFYPKDDTSGCTLEALDFTAMLPEFEKRNAAIIGVSPDSCASHQKFINKHKLGITLISDTEKLMMQDYGVWQEKSMYGKTYMGVVRTTYLISPEGVIKQGWAKVRAKGHAQAVLDALSAVV